MFLKVSSSIWKKITKKKNLKSYVESDQCASLLQKISLINNFHGYNCLSLYVLYHL